MLRHKLLQKPIHNPNAKQPWYITWSEGSLMTLIFNIFVDILFIGTTFGLILLIGLEFIGYTYLQSIIFFVTILLTPIPFIFLFSLYYTNVYHYETPTSSYGLKPTFKLIIPYQLIIVLTSAVILYFI